MKSLVILLLLGSALLITSPAFADTGRITRLIEATQADYDAVRLNFRDARMDCAPAARPGVRSIQEIMRRISARREALAVLGKKGDSLPPEQRGLFRMVVGDLDRTNLSLLALIKDDRGYAGYVRTGDEGLVKGIMGWQEGIRLAIGDTRRCFRLARTVSGPFLLRARLAPAQSH